MGGAIRGGRRKDAGGKNGGLPEEADGGLQKDPESGGTKLFRGVLGEGEDDPNCERRREIRPEGNLFLIATPRTITHNKKYN